MNDLGLISRSGLLSGSAEDTAIAVPSESTAPITESVTAMIRSAALKRWDSRAATFEESSLSWRQLVTQFERTAAHFSHTLPEGARIALNLPNGPDFLVGFLAAAEAGCNAQVMSREWPEETAARVIGQLEPNLLIRSVADLQPTTARGDGQSDAAAMLIAPSIDVPFYTGFTSGSTGLPKGFVRTQRSWIESFHADQVEFGYGPEDVFAVPGHFAHSMPLYGALRGLSAGASILCFASFRPDRVLHSILAQHATVLHAVPTQLQAIVEVACRAELSCGSVRLVLTGGAKASAALKVQIAEVFPNAEFCEFYGTSELSYVTVAKSSESPPPESVGRPMSGVRIHILGERDEPLSPGQVGRIFVETPFRFLGYELAAQEQSLQTVASLPDAICVGDTGCLDGEGFLYLTGRTDRMIVSSGRNIFPEEIEAVLEGHEGISAAAVFGIAEPLRGHRVAAVIRPTLSSIPETATLIRRCRHALPDYKVPRVFFMLGDWPLTTSGKTDFATIVARLKAGALSRLP